MACDPGRVLFLMVISVLWQMAFSSHCVMYGHCGENDYGMENTCSYNETAKPLDDDKALAVMEEICPDLVKSGNLFCCNSEQVFVLRDNMQITNTLGLGRCPSCITNFQKNFCELICSPYQSDFVKVTGLQKNEDDDLIISELEYFMSHNYAKNMFDSCKDVHGLTPGSTVLDLMCGSWGRDCSPIRWLNFMGSTHEDGGFAPFRIKYELHSNTTVSLNGETFHPMDANTTSCADTCTCLDCEAACHFLAASPRPLPVLNDSSWILLNYDGVSVICVIVFLGLTILITAGFLLHKHHSSKSLICDTEVKMERKGSSHRPLIQLKSCSPSASGVDLGSLEEVEPLRSKRSSTSC